MFDFNRDGSKSLSEPFLVLSENDGPRVVVADYFELAYLGSTDEVDFFYVWAAGLEGFRHSASISLTVLCVWAERRNAWTANARCPSSAIVKSDVVAVGVGERERATEGAVDRCGDDRVAVCDKGVVNGLDVGGVEPDRGADTGLND